MVVCNLLFILFVFQHKQLGICCQQASTVTATENYDLELLTLFAYLLETIRVRHFLVQP
jgi:hypothetical protein